MKLSDLKAYIACIEKNVDVSNPNPDVQFWLMRTADIATVKDKEATSSLHFDIDATLEVRDHMIVGMHGVSVQQRYDFTIPLIRGPFYK